MTTWDGPTYEGLEAKRKRLKDEGKFGEFSSGLGLRPRRCTSWLERAEKEMGKDCPDYDAAFIFYWIAFNAAYEEGNTEPRSDRRKRDDFLGKIIKLDSDWRIYEAIWSKFRGPVIALLKNKYVFQPFWDYQNGLPEYERWESRFQRDLNRVHRALMNWDTKDILRVLFYRLYVLRNQFIHGGTTWKGRVNRRQVEDGTMIMAFLVPLFIDLMMDNPDADWGTAYYPFVEDSREQRQRSATPAA